MLGWQFRQELEHVHTVHELARHLEGFLNAGYAGQRRTASGQRVDEENS
jgi:hypothetical protein